MAYVRLYETPDGDSHLETCEVALPLIELEGGNLRMGMSDPIAVAQMTFFHLPQGWVQEWHRAPRRQFVLVHRGAMRIEASAGGTRLIRAGEALLVEDVSGKGHRTTVPDGECAGVVVTLVT
jgi:quercetin dioxygenase-like cupin family protein